MRAFAEQIECPFFETSAKTGQNIRALFEESAMLVFAAAALESERGSDPKGPTSVVASPPEHRACC
jgi:hypothetical protein